MRMLLFIAMLMPMLTHSQERKDYDRGYFSFKVGSFIPKDIKPSIGFYMNPNFRIVKSFYAGLDFGLVKFQEYKGVYAQVLAKLSMMPNNNLGKLSPIMMVEPGIGVYHKTMAEGMSDGELRPNFFGGGGVAFPTMKRGRRFFIVAGYSLFGFKIDQVKTNMHTVGVLTGVMFG
jgi:hypothetical protein